MLDPADYDQPEISGSALMTFGMAWGVNNGLLDRKVYTPVIQKAWAGMFSTSTPMAASATSSRPAPRRPCSSLRRASTMESVVSCSQAARSTS